MFILDSRLQADTYVVGNFPLSQLLLMNNSDYSWFILVPRRAGVTEVFDLDAEDQQRLWQEVLELGAGVKRIFDVEKINIGVLGNVVGQLHVHVVGRNHFDVAWPSPVWGRAATPYGGEDARAVAVKMVAALRPDFERGEWIG